MQQDMERMVRALRDANWLTWDEKRIAMNYQEMGGAYEYTYINQGLIPLEQAMMDLSVGNDGSSNDNIANYRRGDNEDSDEEISQAEERAYLRSGVQNDGVSS
jgi:hypothetical protein